VRKLKISNELAIIFNADGSMEVQYEFRLIEPFQSARRILGIPKNSPPKRWCISK